MLLRRAITLEEEFRRIGILETCLAAVLIILPPETK